MDSMTGQSKKNTIIIIAGPTASGKTTAAIKTALHYRTEIISADSRQCFKELFIGVARPSEEELSAVPHHFIASHSITQKITAATFEKYALEKLDAIFSTSNVAVMVGGTGLYIKAFCEGLDAVPEVPQEVHNEIISSYQKNGLPWLQQQVKEKDPLYFKTGETENPQRLMRALEVVTATDKSIINFQKGDKKKRDFDIIKIGLNVPKEILHQQINSRVDKMMEMGLLEEVKDLELFKELNALQTVGYKELYQFLNGEISLPQAVEDIKKNTRHYAKRQLTWFRKDAEINWMEPKDIDHFLATHTF